MDFVPFMGNAIFRESLGAAMLGLSSFVLLCFALDGVSADQRKNVLFLVSDDMRPELSCFYGPDFPSPVHPTMHTPNLDRLASKSLLLKRAYVQQAICSPSRTSLLTGRRPDTTHVYDLKTYFRESGGNFTTLPQYFKEHGYLSIGMGKVFHPGVASHHDDPISWSEPYYHAPNFEYWSSDNASWVAVPDDVRKKRPLPDEQLAQHALKTLRRVAPAAKTGHQPFFVAVGFHKPHLPFVFPQEFLSYYPKSSIQLPPNPYAPVNMPDVAWFDFAGLRKFHDVKKMNNSGAINETFPDDIVLDLRRAYYSALSFTDFLIGLVIAELDNLGLSNDTIISFWGDHGWQLGEHAEWCKETNFELATHAPMMVHIPSLTDRGIVTEHLTEFVDLYPTLVDAAGLPPMNRCPEESSKVKVCSEGSSLMPLIKDAKTQWKSRVFSQYPRHPDQASVMGYTMRTDRYRYTEWPKFEGKPHYRPDWDTLYGVELYDHATDPEENYNHAYDQSYQVLRKQLSQELHAGWRAALPHQ